MKAREFLISNWFRLFLNLVLLVMIGLQVFMIHKNSQIRAEMFRVRDRMNQMTELMKREAERAKALQKLYEQNCGQRPVPPVVIHYAQN